MKSIRHYLFIFFSGICFMALGQSGIVEDRLSELGIHLPETEPPLANYVKYRIVGDLCYLAGHVPEVTGTLGRELTVEEGYRAARQTGIQMLSTLKHALGDLDRIEQFVKVEGMVNCTSDFTDHSKVINGFSDLMVEVFGDKGKHARVALGHNSLPGNRAVEISAIVQIDSI
ncbi:MAG: RidA family protein [Saprospiraceae bacterium]|nr:RidA family protein [Saprospiraceae bacterium]